MTKHIVDHHTAWLTKLMDWSKHAEQHFKNKKKSRKGLNFMVEGDEETIEEVEEEGEADQEEMVHVLCVERQDIGQRNAGAGEKTDSQECETGQL